MTKCDISVFFNPKTYESVETPLAANTVNLNFFCVCSALPQALNLNYEGAVSSASPLL